MRKNIRWLLTFLLITLFLAGCAHGVERGGFDTA